MRNILLIINKDYIPQSKKLIETLLITSNFANENNTIYIHIETNENTEFIKEQYISIGKEYNFTNFKIIFINHPYMNEMEIPEDKKLSYRRLFAPYIINDNYIYLDADGFVFEDINIAFDYFEKYSKKHFYCNGLNEIALENLNKKETKIKDFPAFYNMLFEKKGNTKKEKIKSFEMYKIYKFYSPLFCYYYSGKELPEKYYREIVDTFNSVGYQNTIVENNKEEGIFNYCRYKHKWFNNFVQTCSINLNILNGFCYRHIGGYKESFENLGSSCYDGIGLYHHNDENMFNEACFLEANMILKYKLSLHKLQDKLFKKNMLPYSFVLYEAIKNNKDLIEKEYYEDMIKDFEDGYKIITKYIDEKFYSNYKAKIRGDGDLLELIIYFENPEEKQAYDFSLFENKIIEEDYKVNIKINEELFSADKSFPTKNYDHFCSNYFDRKDYNKILNNIKNVFISNKKIKEYLFSNKKKIFPLKEFYSFTIDDKKYIINISQFFYNDKLIILNTLEDFNLFTFNYHYMIEVLLRHFIEINEDISLLIEILDNIKYNNNDQEVARKNNKKLINILRKL